MGSEIPKKQTQVGWSNDEFSKNKLQIINTLDKNKDTFNENEILKLIKNEKLYNKSSIIVMNKKIKSNNIITNNKIKNKYEKYNHKYNNKPNKYITCYLNNNMNNGKEVIKDINDIYINDRIKINNINNKSNNKFKHKNSKKNNQTTNKDNKSIKFISLIFNTMAILSMII